jgi:hypothetical protein
MNHAAICIRLQIYVRENHNDEERNQEGARKSCCKESYKEGARKEKEVVNRPR